MYMFAALMLDFSIKVLKRSETDTEETSGNIRALKIKYLIHDAKSDIVSVPLRCDKEARGVINHVALWLPK
jgi:hypothetical protein